MKLKELFAVKKDAEACDYHENSGYLPPLISFIDRGKKYAEDLGGHPEVIHPALHTTYLQVKKNDN